jgi:predicted unusual protein kinase regulating ubiquinone biosynthesis (AarF/ABC1/UbiB family)
LITLSPIILTLPLYSLNITNNNDWYWNILRYCIRNSGSCNTKFAQWIATRPDLFPLILCQKLQTLQSNAIKSSWKHAQQCLIHAFGNNWNDSIKIMMNDDDTNTPIFIGSGCVAQVIKGKVNDRDVAIKIIHPGIKEGILLLLLLLLLLLTLLLLLLPRLLPRLLILIILLL